MKLALFLLGSLSVAVLLSSRLSVCEQKASQKAENQPVATSCLGTFGSPGNPVELGKVNWSRDFDRSKASAATSGKPLLILFQEVPGCSNCTRFGNAVLSHPLVVEAIETFFEPVCIFNNKGGEDRRVLEKFGEPSWNNPVVRIIDAATEADLTPRLSNSYTPAGLASNIVAALEKRGQRVPAWLDLLEKGLRAEESGTGEAVVAMSCFWTGEGKLGAMDGVVATEPGFMAGREVVKVSFDPTMVSYDELVKKSRESSCASTVFYQNEEERAAAEAAVGKGSTMKKVNFSPDREPKYYLSKTDWRFVPMTETQASRANALVGRGESPEPVLSPRQVELGNFISKNPARKWKEAIGEADLVKAWASAEAVRK